MTAPAWPAAALVLVRDGARLGDCTTCGGAGSVEDPDRTRATTAECRGCGGLGRRLLFNQGGDAA